MHTVFNTMLLSSDDVDVPMTLHSYAGFGVPRPAPESIERQTTPLGTAPEPRPPDASDLRYPVKRAGTITLNSASGWQGKEPSREQLALLPATGWMQEGRGLQHLQRPSPTGIAPTLT